MRRSPNWGVWKAKAKNEPWAWETTADSSLVPQLPILVLRALWRSCSCWLVNNDARTKSSGRSRSSKTSETEAVGVVVDVAGTRRSQSLFFGLQCLLLFPFFFLFFSFPRTNYISLITSLPTETSVSLFSFEEFRKEKLQLQCTEMKPFTNKGKK